MQKGAHMNSQRLSQHTQDMQKLRQTNLSMEKGSRLKFILQTKKTNNFFAIDSS